MSGFDDDFLAGAAPPPAPAPSAKGAAAAPSPSAPSDDFDGFGVSGGSAEPEAGFLSPEAADAAKATAQALKAKSGAALASATKASQAGARRLGQAVARVSPRQWATGLGVLALVVGLSFGVRWWMHRPATPAVAAAKTEVSAAPTSASTATVATPPVVTTTAPKKQAAPVTAATLLAAPAIVPTTSPSPTVERHAPRPAVAVPKKDPWQVAHAADIQKSMQHAGKKSDDKWAKDQSARLDAFFKKKH